MDEDEEGNTRLSNFSHWLEGACSHYLNLSDEERNKTLDCLFDISGPAQLQHLYKKVDELLHRDFVKLLPAELREHLLSFLDPKSLCAICCVCNTWNRLVSSSARVWQRACHSLGLVIDRNLNKGDGTYWKTYFLSMARRMQQLKTGKGFDSHMHNRNLRRITAVYYFQNILATASDSKIIQLWDCKTNSCLKTMRTDMSVSSMKFDENLLLVCSYFGQLACWDIASGFRLVEYLRHTGAVFCVDFSQEMDIVVSGSADKKIKVWSLPTGELLTTLEGHSNWVLKLLLKSLPPRETRWKGHLMLFSMDRKAIVVWLLMLGSVYGGPEGLYISRLYSISLATEDPACFAPGLHLDGMTLCFVRQAVEKSKNCTLCKYNVIQRQMEEETSLNMNVRLLLAVGRKYAAIVRPHEESHAVDMVVLDTNTEECVGMWKIPPNRATTPNCAQITIGESDWLNGLNGVNDSGMVLAAGLDNNNLYILNWLPRETCSEIIAGTSS